MQKRISFQEEGSFRKGSGCADQIFSFKMVVEKNSKRKILYAAFMDLEKNYDRVDWVTLWDVLQMYGMEEN